MGKRTYVYTASIQNKSTFSFLLNNLSVEGFSLLSFKLKIYIFMIDRVSNCQEESTIKHSILKEKEIKFLLKPIHAFGWKKQL